MTLAIQASNPGIAEDAAMILAEIQSAVNFGSLGAGTGGEGTPGPPGYGFPVGPFGFN